MNAEQRDIFLVPFPFSDLSKTKVRPVLVISKNNFNNHSDDVIVCAITSNVTKGQYTVLINSESLESGIIDIDCAVKVENLAKLDKRILIKKIGKLKSHIFAKIIEKFHALFE